jgi:hypothetical protein
MLKCHSLHLTQADYTNLSPSASLRSLSGDYHKMVLFSLFLRFFYTCLRDYCACPRDTHTTSSIGSSKGEPTTIRHRNPLCICLRSFQINCLSQLSSKTEHIVFGYARVQCSGGFDWISVWNFGFILFFVPFSKLKILHYLKKKLDKWVFACPSLHYTTKGTYSEDLLDLSL